MWLGNTMRIQSPEQLDQGLEGQTPKEIKRSIAGIRFGKRWLLLAGVIPVLLWYGFFVFAPYSTLFLYSFWSMLGDKLVTKFTFINYLSFFKESIYYGLYFKTLKMAFYVTVSCMLIGYPTAYFIARMSGRSKNLLFLLISVSLCSSYIVRVYAWKSVLGMSGALNALLVALHILREPSPLLLYNNFTVYLALTEVLLPFMLLPLLTALEKIPKSLLEASKDLGANNFITFWKVTFPLSLPGVLAGATFTFVLTLGDFITPVLVGGTGGILMGKVIWTQFGLTNNWPLGAALGFLVAIMTILIISVVSRFGAMEEM
jgi:spermidine/putrescine transport system permease protein